MKKNQIIFNTVFTICLFIIYVIPISFNLKIENASHGDVFYYTRLLFLPISILLFFLFNKKSIKNIISYLILIIAMIGFYIRYQTISLTSCMVLVYFIIFDEINRNKERFIIGNCLKMIVKICTGAFIIQLLIMKIINPNNVGIISSFKDENYTAYFLIFLYFINKSIYDKKIINILLLILAILTFSRMAMLAVSIIILLNITNKTNEIKIKIIEKPLLTFMIIFLIWIIISFGFVKHFESIKYEYEYLTGIKRVTRVVDYSNYIRTSINVNLIKNLSLKNIFIGYNEEDYNEIVFFKGKIAHPHNTLLSIYAESGIIFAFEYVRRFTSIFKGNEKMFNYFVILVLYSMTLGPSTYYGVDLLLLCLISILESSERDEKQT